MTQVSIKVHEVARQSLPSISVVIPTYQREQVLLDTIAYLLQLDYAPNRILVIDQTPVHGVHVEKTLESWNRGGRIAWIRFPVPSVTHAMNVGLLEAHTEIVLFLDDDIIPANELILAHTRAHAKLGCHIVAGQVLQPGEEVLSEDFERSEFRYCFGERRWVREFIGCNFSVKRQLAIDLGGFDENFLHVAYRFEAEFCDRAISAGERILFEPAASIRHLKAGSGGTRSFGSHLTTVKPSHSVGAYYFLLRARNVERRFRQMALRPLRAVCTRHHLYHPWWIPFTLLAEFGGFVWAVALFFRGPRLMRDQRDDEVHS